MRNRNTKNLARRIDRRYLRTVFPLPLWRRILTAALLAIGLGWLGLYALARNQTVYSSGPLTTSHAFLGKDCAACHGAKAMTGKKVTDAECSACHNAPLHQARQTFNPACVACHVEHRGAMRLAGALDHGCVSCHGNLKTKSGPLTVASSVDSFENHPQFAAIRAGSDPTGIRFNHQKHVGKDLGQKCSDCHQPAAPAVQLPHSHVSAKPLMGMPKYADNCAACHPLAFDDKVTDAAPHEKTAVVHQFVVDSFTKYIAAHAAELGKGGAPANAAAWVTFKTAASEKTLWGETCARCHDMKNTDASGLPVVAAAKMTPRWFTKASFDHARHAELTCVSCHANAMTSTASSTLMLPGIEVCRQCHSAGSESAGSTCSTCHVYHDWSKEKAVEGKFAL